MFNVTLDGVTTTTQLTNITYSGLNNMINHTVIVIPYNNVGTGPPATMNIITLTPSGQPEYNASV